MTIRAETLSYQVEGLTMVGDYYVDDAAAGPRPGILVFPDARGMDEFTRERARRLAGLGFAALAGDLYGDGRYIDDSDEAIAFAMPLAQKPESARARAGAAFDALAARAEVDGAKMAAIGYCFGGNIAVELARGGADIVAAVGFHGGAVPPSPADSRKIKGKLLICTGAEDPFIPLEMRAAFEKDMREAGVDWRMHIYGRVYHSFTVPGIDERGELDRLRYDAGADARSWAEMLALFEEVFG
jgi:dienelactone hydrolase